MKNIATSFLALSLTACACEPVYLPVYTVPDFEMPVRPQLRSTQAGTMDSMSKNVELDLIDLSTYATQLENIVKTIKSYKPVSEVIDSKQ